MDLTALLMTLAAGLATPVGGLFALVTKRRSDRLQAFGMGLAGGVLVYLALRGLVTESLEDLEAIYGHSAHLLTLGALALGMGVMLVFDRFLPGGAHGKHEEEESRSETSHALLVSGIAAAVAISIHNIPEGVMLYVTASHTPLEALPVMLAVAIHNLPIGLSIAIPIYYATGRRSAALLVCLLSGLVEVLGALIGWLLEAPMESPLGPATLALIAGIMVYVSFDELIPTALHGDRRHAGLSGILLGILLMALTMALLHH